MSPREVFGGPRLRVRTAVMLRLRALVALVALGVVVGLAVGAGLSGGVGYAVQALLHSLRSGG